MSLFQRLYTPFMSCLNRSITEQDFQRIQELLTTSLGAMEERNNKRFDKLEHNMKEMRQDMDEVREGMEVRFEAIGQQFNEIDKRFVRLEEKMDRNHQEVTKRIDTLSEAVEKQTRESLRAQGALKLLTMQHEELAGRVAIVESKLQAA